MQPTVLNERYEIEHKIGEGGMAVVYKSHDKRLNRYVAIKVLHQHYADDIDFLTRFQHEAQAAAVLSHPNVVNVYDVGQDGPYHYIIMEYVEGENLKTLLNREAPLTVARAVSVAESVAYALESAHQRGLIHRDIKPQNILVTPGGHIRITDFGIAKSEFSTAMTQTGFTFGTADYISPEQAQGTAATPQSDIYSLGVTLYEMLTGHLPFTGDTPVGVATQHVNTAPPSMRQFNPHISHQLEALVMRALAKDPAQRPATAQEFARLLRTYREAASQHTAYAAPMGASASSQREWQGGTPAGHGAAPPPPRRPKQSGNQGCGAFVLGLLLLIAVLGTVLAFSTGTINALIAGTSPVSQGGVVMPGTSQPATSTVRLLAGSTPQSTVTSTPEPNATGDTTPTRTPTPTVSPTASPTTSPTATVTPTLEPTVVVPDLRNQPEVEARSALIRLDLTPVNDDEPRNDTTVPAGNVLDQAVPAGSTVRQGERITYTLSLGPQLVDVPNLIQVSLSYAQQEAERLGLSVQVSEEPSATVSEGFVINQRPNPGSRVQPGDTLFLSVSVGDKIRFPQVIGQQLDSAERLLEINGLNLEYVDRQGPDRLDNFNNYRPNEVVSALANRQPVSNGDYIPRGSNIVLGVRAP